MIDTRTASECLSLRDVSRNASLYRMASSSLLNPNGFPSSLMYSPPSGRMSLAPSFHSTTTLYSSVIFDSFPIGDPINYSGRMATLSNRRRVATLPFRVFSPAPPWCGGSRMPCTRRRSRRMRTRHPRPPSRTPCLLARRLAPLARYP
jgi:hypothetical protein